MRGDGASSDGAGVVTTSVRSLVTTRNSNSGPGCPGRPGPRSEITIEIFIIHFCYKLGGGLVGVTGATG